MADQQDGLCACGCGTTLDPAGASDWWASEACQKRWQADQVGALPAAPRQLPWTWAPPPVPEAPTAAYLRRRSDREAVALRIIVDMSRFGAAITKVGRLMHAAGGALGGTHVGSAHRSAAEAEQREAARAALAESAVLRENEGQIARGNKNSRYLSGGGEA